MGEEVLLASVSMSVSLFDPGSRESEWEEVLGSVCLSVSLSLSLDHGRAKTWREEVLLESICLSVSLSEAGGKRY